MVAGAVLTVATGRVWHTAPRAAATSSSRGAFEAAPAEAGSSNADGLARHVQQPRNATWAKKSESSLREDLTKLGQEKAFTVVAIDCRTTSCASTLEWETRTAADATFEDLLHAFYELNCERSIVLSRGDEEPVRAQLLFECTAKP